MLFRDRPTREEVYINNAKYLTLRSTCSRMAVGAVVVDGLTNKSLAYGYNGSLKNMEHCTADGTCLMDGHCIRAEHAEINALNCLERKYKNLHLYCTHMPCIRCLRRCIQESVKVIYFMHWYDQPQRDELFLNKHNNDLDIIQINLVHEAPKIMSEIKSISHIFHQGVLNYDNIYRTESRKQVCPPC
jgi:dCMP deaminase